MSDADCPTLRYADDAGEPREVLLEESRPRLLIGRSRSCDVVIGWDTMMSREHAIVELIGTHWFVSDDGMSRHGTYVRPERAQACRAEQQVRGRRRLEANDRLVLGQTVFTFRLGHARTDDTAPRTRTTRQPAPVLTPAQERVLTVLCRPLQDDPDAMPASNQEIGKELFIGPDAIKDHLQALYRKFGVQDLQRGEKRIRLAQLALRNGRV
jgi:pSer/pThr/pTyr-binding forkhead associated (FHA) protein